MLLCKSAPRSSMSDRRASAVGSDCHANSAMRYSREKEIPRNIEPREHSRICRRPLRANRHAHDHDVDRERLGDVHTRSRSRSPRSHRRSRREGQSWSRRKSDRSSERSSGRSRSSSRHRKGWRPQNDEEGHLIYRSGDRLGRYEILSTLGQGTFGKVTRCKNLDSGKRVALKIIKNIEKYRHAAKIEIRVLKHLREHSNEWNHCVCMLDSFDYYGHICIVFQELGLSLFEFMRFNNFRSYPLEQVQLIAYQVTCALRYMHSLKLTHTDLKPENILLVNSDSSRQYDSHEGCYVRALQDASICVIDFGSATYESEHHSTVVSTRHYRAPEVILEIGWSYPCDMWSLGCIIFELYTGITLFQTHSNLEHLAMMEAYLGPLPSSMLSRSTKTKYVSAGRLRWDQMSTAGIYVKHNCQPLFHYANSSLSIVVDMFDLIRQLLSFEPSHRLTASEALRHHFFHSFTR